LSNITVLKVVESNVIFSNDAEIPCAIGIILNVSLLVAVIGSN
jgi:hypothetical protein